MIKRLLNRARKSAKPKTARSTNQKADAAPPAAQMPSESPKLIAELRDLAAEVACGAAAALGKIKEPAVVDALITVVVNADNFFHSTVRAAAARSLGQIGDRRAVPCLLQALRDPIAEVSAEAVGALGEIRDGAAVPPLLAAAANADGYFAPMVRLAAVQALGRLDSSEAAHFLRATADNAYEDPVMRQAALATLPVRD
jgi:HEAT repeat protein